MLSDIKKQAAEKALEYVKSGTVIGLGTGSTVEIFMRLLADQIHQKKIKNIRGIPTSKKTEILAHKMGIPLISWDANPVMDLAVDGADQVDEKLNLIKGLGHALLREKIVEIYAKKLIIIVDESKMTKHLGVNCPLPVEIIPFGAEAHLKWLKTLGCEPELLLVKGKPMKTDNGGYLIHCFFKNGIKDPYRLAGILDGRPGISAHGLFLDMADIVIVGGKKGVQVLKKGFFGVK